VAISACRGTGEFVSRSRAGVDQLTEVKDFRSPSVTAVQSSGGQLWFAAAADPLSRRGRQGVDAGRVWLNGGASQVVFQPASRPSLLTWRTRRSAASRVSAVATISSWSP
jgi:type II secretory pathway component PulM